MARRIVIGVAGGSASGKSTYAGRLAESLGDLRVEVLAMDTYFCAEKPLHRGPLADREWPDYNQPASFHVEDLIAALDDADAEVVIVEGLLILHLREVRERCDLRLFVDAPADVRIVRRLRRNLAERGLSFDEIADYYTESVRWRHEEFVEPSRAHADLIVNGLQLSDAAVAAVASHARAVVEG